MLELGGRLEGVAEGSGRVGRPEAEQLRGAFDRREVGRRRRAVERREARGELGDGGLALAGEARAVLKGEAPGTRSATSQSSPLRPPWATMRG